MGSAAQLHFGTDLHHLAALLHARVRAFRTPERGALAKVYVVAPHRAMREWLKQELAALGGAVGNVRFLSPGQVLARCGRSTGATLGAAHALLDDAHLDALPAAKRYIDHDGDDEARRELRRYTLASRLASQFTRYAAQGFAPSGKDWRTTLWKAAAPTLVPQVPEAPLDAPLFVFDVPAPGVDFIAATEALGVERHVFLRSQATTETADLWLRHGAQLRLGEERWRAHGAVEASAPAQPGPRQVPDVTVLEAPSIRRACEAAAAQVWSWVRDESVTPRLHFHEIALVIPSSHREKLQPVLREVLDEAHELPKVLWNVPLGPNNRLGALAQQLLELPSTPLRRAEVLSILTHPLVQGAFEGELPESWSQWLDAVGIFHGLDATAHAGTYLAGKQVAHWDQGLTRLALGAFLGSERSGEIATLDLPGWKIVPEEITQSSMPAVGLLLQFVRSLLSDAVALREAKRSAADWRDLIAAYLAAYLRPGEDTDQRLRSALIGALDAFEDLGLEGPFGWEIARTVAQGALSGVSGSLGTHLTQGLVIATPEDLAGLPFRRIVFFGVEEGGFPSKSRLSELDQRVDDEGRALPAFSHDDARLVDARNFFQLIESATGPVCLVPIAHDPLTGEKREPSLLVKDLESHLARAGAKVRRFDLPLHRREQSVDPDFLWALPEAKVEAQLHELGTELTKNGAPLPPFSSFSPAWQALLGRYPVPPPRPGEERVIELSLSRVVKFLEYPTQAYAEQRLGFRDEEDGRDDLVDEPFEHSPLSAAMLYRETLIELLASCGRDELKGKKGEKRLEAHYLAARARRVASGQSTLGVFAALQAEEDLAKLKSLLAVCLELPEFAPAYRRLRWGQANSTQDPSIDERPALERRGLTVRGAKVTVRLSGLSNPIDAKHEHLFRYKHSLKPGADPGSGLNRKYALPAWFEHLMLQLSGERSERQAMAISSAGTAYAWTFPDVDPTQAGRHLDTVLTALLTECIGFKCPTVTVLELWDALAPGLPWDERAAQLEAHGDHVLEKIDGESYSVVRHVERLRLPTEAEFDRLYARFAPFVEARLADEAQRSPPAETEKPGGGRKARGSTS